MLIFMLLACNRAPEAPTELNELAGWLYGNIPNKDEEALAAGVDNLRVWLDAHREETLEGYKVDNLAQSTLDELDDQDRPAEGLVGAAITTVGAPSLKQVAQTVLVEDQMVVFPDTFERCDRTMDVDPECFVDGSCDDLAIDASAEYQLPLSIEMSTEYESHYRWVDTVNSGRVMVSRSWLLEPPVLSASWITLDAQYGMTVTYPEDDGGVLRLQAMWAQVQIINSDVSPDTLVGILLGSLQDNDETMYTWIADNL